MALHRLRLKPFRHVYMSNKLELHCCFDAIAESVRFVQLIAHNCYRANTCDAQRLEDEAASPVFGWIQRGTK